MALLYDIRFTKILKLALTKWAAYLQGAFLQNFTADILTSPSENLENVQKIFHG